MTCAASLGGMQSRSCVQKEMRRVHKGIGRESYQEKLDTPQSHGEQLDWSVYLGADHVVWGSHIGRSEFVDRRVVLPHDLRDVVVSHGLQSLEALFCCLLHSGIFLLCLDAQIPDVILDSPKRVHGGWVGSLGRP